MSGLTIALIAQALLAASLLIDKALLKTKAPGNIVVYVFWLGILNAAGILLFPFGFTLPDFGTAAVALVAGIVFLTALAAYYTALREGEVSHTLPIAGGLIPIATLFFANILLPERLNVAEYIGFGFIITGTFVMFLSDRSLSRKTFPWILLASVLFGASSVLAKTVFTSAGFVTGFVLLKTGTLLAGIAILVFPRWRAMIFARGERAPLKNMPLYFGNRALAGGAAFLILYAISREHPALVEATAGFRYALIFIAAFVITKLKPMWLKEQFGFGVFIGKCIATVLIVVGLAGLGLQDFYERQPVPHDKDVRWGITFSTLMAERLGLAWQDTYLAIIRDLKPGGIRIAVYWPEIETEDDVFDFSQLDFQMDEAARAGVPVVLAIGQKVPRWPECHTPTWVGEFLSSNFEFRNDAAQRQFEKELFEYLRMVVKRYKDHPALEYWQVENEPFLAFGECDHAMVARLLDSEIALVRALDANHNILLTDGGEFGDWVRAARRADVFGTTLYRRVHHRIFGNVIYPLTPEFYSLRRDVLRIVSREPKKVIAIEVGLEPWGEKQIQDLSYDEQIKLFTIKNFEDDLTYARRARFDTYYLWGAEWWYFLKEKHGDDRYWTLARDNINE